MTERRAILMRHKLLATLLICALLLMLTLYLLAGIISEAISLRLEVDSLESRLEAIEQQQGALEARQAQTWGIVQVQGVILDGVNSWVVMEQK